MLWHVHYLHWNSKYPNKATTRIYREKKTAANKYSECPNAFVVELPIVIISLDAEAVNMDGLYKTT